MALVKIACDHAGFQRKQQVIQWLKEHGHKVEDFGPLSEDRVDYPDYADQVCRNLQANDVGVLICGSGQGMAMRANKHPAVRAALCWSPEVATLAREHNDANVLCLGARLMDEALCASILACFFSTPFSGGRHQGRVDKISKPT